MSTDLIRESAERLFAPRATPRSPEALWQEATEAGFGLALLSEAEGGFGLSTAEALEPVIIAARQAVSLPLAETLLGNLLLARSGAEPAPGAVVVIADPAQPCQPGPAAEVLLAAPGGGFRRLAAADCRWQAEPSLSGEPMARLLSAPEGGAVLSPGLSPLRLRAMAALLRAAQISGALEGVLRMTLTYAGERVQFGKPLSRFQAIQHGLAQMAAQTAAARAGVLMAATAADQPLADEVFAAQAAAAKIRAGEAAGPVADLAHQIHGAIGFSGEYPLGALTRRLWLWRDLDGDEAFWSHWLGSLLMAQRDRGLWAQITDLQGGSL